MSNLPVYITDTTLRDGEQAPGVVFSLDEKIKIAEVLDEIGINEVEIGTPTISEQEVNDLRTIVEQGFNFRSSCWCRAKNEDIDMALDTGATSVNISFPTSDLQLKPLEKKRHWLFDIIPSIINYAQERFPFVSVGMQDASRTDLKFLTELVKFVCSMNVFRIRIADTIGIQNPFSIYDQITEIKKHSGETFIEFHGHNDFGMATANTLAAIKAGAQYASVTVNGLGERAGNAPLEEVVMALKHSANMDIDINTSKFQKLSAMVEQFSNRRLSLSKPIVGDMALAHESGIHTKSLLQDRLSYQPFMAAEIGKTESEFIFGKHSGKAAVIDYFDNIGIHLAPEDALTMQEAIKAVAIKKKRSLRQDELINIYSKYHNNFILDMM